MIKITPAAVVQIKLSAEQSNNDGLALRIAASRNDDNSIHYGMGFDDTKEDDVTVSVTDDIKVIISASSAELLKDSTIDFVELETDKFQFIFLNPNDPTYKPPTE